MSFIKSTLHLFCLTAILMLAAVTGSAQVTTASMSGIVKDAKGESLIGATVIAVHTPSGTRYGTVTQLDGDYLFPAMRVGGPYKVTVTYVGYQEQNFDNIFLSLGSTGNANVVLQESATALEGVEVVANRNDIFSSGRTGASSTFNRNTLNSLPTLGRTINDITKYNAYGNGRSFAGQDSRFNNFSIDGSNFNNGFGLGSQAQAGGRTGSSAISLDAIEEVQLNIAPFDVRQSGFAGASINAVTRAGTNEFSGSIFGFQKNQNLIGSKIDGADFKRPTFDEKTGGFRLGGPIIKDKLFFFVNAEINQRSAPALDWVANRPGATGNVSRTTAADLEDLGNFMRTNFGYYIGAIDQYNNESASNKYLARIDYNINDNHKLALRYAHHDSKSDANISDSNSGNTAGNGNRQNRALAISPQNSGYIIQDNARSFVAELNSTFKSKFFNNLIATYNKQIEDREYRQSIFPTVDILKDGSTYTSIGFDPFTPDNRLNYTTLNLTDNFTMYLKKHKVTVGASYEHFNSNNLFFYASNGAYVYESIDDFKKAALQFKNDPNNPVSAVKANRFNYRYSLLAENAVPWQELQVNTISGYVQDDYQVLSNLKVTAGVRADVINFGATATDYANPVVAAFDFKNDDGTVAKVNTGAFPKSKIYWSPRLGFNWDVTKNQNTQVRGGTGLFLSRMPYVLISNQLGNNGVNIGSVNATATTAYPFTTDPSKFKPANTDITKLKGYGVNASADDLKFPQIWKSNLAIDQKLPLGLVGTLEAIYNQNINALRYYDVNRTAADRNFAGADTRPRFPASGAASADVQNKRYINPTINEAYILSNTKEGYSYSMTAKLEKPVQNGFSGMLGYTYAYAKDLVSVGNTAGEAAAVASVAGLNRPVLSWANNDLRHRGVGYINYRKEYGGNFGGASMITIGGVYATGSKVSYIYSNDMNGDGLTNDLIFVPNAGTDLKFADITTGSGATLKTLFTAAEQQAALTKYIDAHPYLSTRKGGYAERNGGIFPSLARFDVAFEQDIYMKVAGKRNTLRFRLDIFNASNLLSSKLGVGNQITTTNPLTFASVGADGIPVYRMATQVIADPASTTGGTKSVLLQDAFVKSKTIDDVYQIQLGVRYIFN